jgi:uncharacterized protein (TIGR03790 family)
MYKDKLVISLHKSSTLPLDPPSSASGLRTARFCWVAMLLILGQPATSVTWAGLVPNEVVIVVNGASQDSRTLANHYIALRNLPASNVIVLESVPNSEVISVAEFREKILKPLLQEMDRRRLGNHVQCIAYSADFPTAIDIQTDIQPLGKLPVFYTARASINAVTFFYASVQAGDPGYIQPSANAYARQQISSFFNNPLGKLTQEAWQTITDKIAAGEHQEAAALLEAMFQQYPMQFPVAYLAAAEYSLAGDVDKAMEMLEKAVGMGWSAGGYLKGDARFEKCRQDSRYQLLMLSIDESQSNYQPTVGFDVKRAWAPNGVASTDLQLGSRYILSTVLGVTRGAGTTLEEAIQGLSRSAAADFTQPEGSFYFCATGDVRTKTREPGFADAIESLQGLGFHAEVVPDQLPMKKQDVLGAMIGTPNFDWSSSGSTLLPGSIAENLTSVGAVMNSLGGQTKLTELIKAGAAGSSGTVTEPYSLQWKFPHPRLYVHYASGLSLAESFYASVPGPYQLLIVGDPLCQPFAAPPKAVVDTKLRHLQADEPLKFPLKYATSGPVGKRQPSAAVAISVQYDGEPAQTGPALTNVEVKLKDQPPGYHEVRLVSIGDDALMQRSEIVLPFWIGDKEVVSIDAPKAVSFEERRFSVRFTAAGAMSVSLWHDSEQLMAMEGASGEFQVPVDALGVGPVRLQARALLPNGKTASSVPHLIQINP